MTRGTGWGTLHTLSDDAVAPALAMSPDGRGHLVFSDHTNTVTTTLAPGAEDWSPLAILGVSGHDQFQGSVWSRLSDCQYRLRIARPNDDARSFAGNPPPRFLLKAVAEL